MKKLYWMVPLYLVLVVAWMYALPTHTSYRAPETRELNDLGNLGVALERYASDHGGKFPARIADLPAGSIDAGLLQFHDPVTKQAVDWVYYSGHTVDDPPDTVLATSPEYGGGKEPGLVLYTNGICTMVRGVSSHPSGLAGGET